VNVIHSLEKQNCDPFVVLIVDNASEDNTVEIIQNIFKNYSLKNKYLLIRNEKNIGAISSFLDRLELFESEWIIMVHQDDVYHDNHMSTLAKSIAEAEASVGLIFTAMQRVDANNNEKLAPPTISSKLSSKNRFENFLLSLQITPFNFPASALRKSALTKLETTRHTTAFNDSELLLRMTCNFDVTYVPSETMHYRVFEGNAASQTKVTSNDRAILIGLNEIFHSQDFQKIIKLADSDTKVSRLISAINNAIDIRITDLHLRLLAKNIAAETLIRKIGYFSDEVSSNLVQSLKSLNLQTEATLAQNQQYSQNFLEIPLANSDNLPNFKGEKIESGLENIKNKKPLNRIPLNMRENLFNALFSSPIMRIVKRPFVKTWRFRNKGE
jgi:glycosyltransferase involved in cell wall biosynthesis